MPSPPDHENLPPVSVVVPTRNEERTIEACLQSIVSQDYPRGRLEIIVLDGESEDKTRELVAKVAATTDVPVRLVGNPERSVPAALNKAIHLATGEFLIRVDAHSIAGPAYVKDSVAGNLEHDAVLAGGWVETIGHGSVGRAVAGALRSPFAMGNPVSWQQPSTPREVHSVPCGSYRLSALKAIGGFDEAQRANQDYEANYRLRRAGGRLVLLPGVSHRYIARDSFRRLARQFFRYGFFKARVMLKHPASVRPRHLVPAAGLVVAAATAVAALWWPPAAWVLAAAGGGYVALLVLASASAGRRLGRSAVLLPAVLATMHLAWAAGNLAGLVRWLAVLPTVRDESREHARARTA